MLSPGSEGDVIVCRFDTDPSGGPTSQSQYRHLFSPVLAAETAMQAMSPITSIPSEILERIFVICLGWIYGRRLPENCLAWSQVCTYWRRVAVGSPRLWRSIDISHSRFSREFLERSGSAPIFILANSCANRLSNTLLPHAERIYSINVVLRSNDMQQLLSSLGSELPNLSTLALASQPGSPNLKCHIRMQSVRYLALDGIAVSWDDCSHLAQLALRGLGEGFAPSASQLCSILERSPELVSLRAENVAIAVPFGYALNHTITLPQLREIVLFSQTPQFIQYMLRQLQIPPPAKLQLTCPSYNRLSELGTIFDKYENFRDNGISLAALRLRRWSVQLLRPKSAPWSEHASDISLSITFLSPLHAPHLDDFRLLFNISKLTALELDAIVLDDIPIDSMRSLFAAMPSLQTLRVALNGLQDLLSLLGPPMPRLTSGVLCPNLRLLSFSRSADVWWSFAERWLPNLLACVMNRAQYARLHTLRFIRCHGIDTRAIRHFEPFVENVFLEGYEG